MLNDRTACHLVDTAADAIRTGSDSFHEVLDGLPAAIYVTDSEGTITYFNEACVELAGRRPRIGVDKWCVTAKIYTVDGELLPHDQCPMAHAIRERRPVRDVEAIAERPDGSKFHFVPYPTPLFDDAGELTGAVNLIIDVSEQRRPEYLHDQAARCRRLAASINDRRTAQTLRAMADKYDEQSSKLDN